MDDTREWERRRRDDGPGEDRRTMRRGLLKNHRGIEYEVLGRAMRIIRLYDVRGGALVGELERGPLDWHERPAANEDGGGGVARGTRGAIGPLPASAGERTLDAAVRRMVTEYLKRKAEAAKQCSEVEDWIRREGTPEENRNDTAAEAPGTVRIAQSAAAGDPVPGSPAVA